jgi:hypothetical protein
MYRSLASMPQRPSEKCAVERELGERAPTRPRALMDQGELMLAEITCSRLLACKTRGSAILGRRCAVLTVQREDWTTTLGRDLIKGLAATASWSALE